MTFFLRTKALAVIVLSVLLLTLHACNNSQTEETSEIQATENTVVDGQTLEGLRFNRLDGTPFLLSEMKGKRVFVSFWATWCRPCIQEMPSIEQAQMTLGDEVVFLLVSDETPETIQQFIDAKNYNLTFVKAGFPLEKLGITGLPTNIIFDKEGKQEQFLVGGRDWADEGALAMIKGEK